MSDKLLRDITRALKGTVPVVSSPTATRKQYGVTLTSTKSGVYVQLYLEERPAFSSPRLFSVDRRQDSRRMEQIKRALERAGLRANHIFVEESKLLVTSPQ